MTSPPRILAIAGSDSSGGAGIQADIKTITMLGGYAMSAITAVTAQNSLGVQAVYPLPHDWVAQQFISCKDIGIDAIKIGMLGRFETAEMIWELLLTVAPETPIVFDPVIQATSGESLNEGVTIAAMHALADLACLVTPNQAELKVLGGIDALLEHCPAVLVTGGDGQGANLVDRLVTREGEIACWESPRIDTRHTHGTGCTLSSAIATLLGNGMELEDAIAGAREFVREALLKAPGFGAGHGPLGHQAVR
jgi:hydroxymethylpyrimidine/phosphomethylpyrimidine kinase